MVNIALKRKPPFICIVPEKRKEITTEGGLNLNFRRNYLKKIIEKFKKKIRVSLFIEPKINDIKLAKFLKADCVEIHTGKICRQLINLKKTFKKEFLKIKKAVDYANRVGLEVHAGHGLTYKSAKILSKTKRCARIQYRSFFSRRVHIYWVAKMY